MSLSDRAVSLIRTLVPKTWGLIVGALLAWLGMHAPWAISLLDFLGIDLDGAAAVVLVIAATEAAWYAVWRWAEPRIPDWLTRLVLGSAQEPTYSVLTPLEREADAQAAAARKARASDGRHEA